MFLTLRPIMTTQTFRRFTAIALSGMLLCTAANAQIAPKPADDLMPPATTSAVATPGGALDGETHPALKLMPDKSELVPLDREASSVIIGSPSHIGVVLDTPKLAVVIPRAEGATYFTVLDKDGNVIMQRHVLVGSPKKNYIRVRRSCSNAADGADCQPTSVYFCPDMCHEIGKGGTEESDSSASSTSE